MSRTLILRSALASAVIGGTITWLHGRTRTSRLPRHVIPIVTPVITMRFAEDVLARLEHASGDEVFVVLHTDGGEVAACVLIADALRKFARSTAVVPYMAFSGGTIVALNARRLMLGKNAALSAVDPLIYGQRARHIQPTRDREQNPLHPLATEYSKAVESYLRETLRDRLADTSPSELERAMSVFMGESAPHAWPIHAQQLAALGLSVELADPAWSGLVDQERRARRQACVPEEDHP
jgi:membrane-bound ClpP family serine protease